MACTPVGLQLIIQLVSASFNYIGDFVVNEDHLTEWFTSSWTLLSNFSTQTAPHYLFTRYSILTLVPEADNEDQEDFSEWADLGARSRSASVEDNGRAERTNTVDRRALYRK